MGYSKYLLFTLLASASVCMAAGAGKLVSASVDCDSNNVVAVFSLPAPDLGAVSDASKWVVNVRTAERPKGETIQVTVQPDPFYANTGQVKLLFPARITSKIIIAIDVLYLDSNSIVTWHPKPIRCAPGLATAAAAQEHTQTWPLEFHAADKKDDADVYLSGLWVPAVGAKPTYSFDGFFKLPVIRKNLWQVNAGAKAKADARPNIDPDSFSASVSLQRIFPFALGARSAWDFQWDVASWEFTRKTETYNFVSAPRVVLAAGVPPKISGGDVKATLDAELSLGGEVGANLRSSIPAVRNGYGTIARLIPGATVYASWRPSGVKLLLTSDYKDRILATREPFVDSRRTGPIPFQRGSRHTLTDSLEITPNAFFGFTIKHEYGSLPPAFQFVDHKVTVGLTLMWKWR